ncbi:putative RdRP [Lampyris noctiluca partitivirus-like virus 1]|nr:putative RdRP [Lampyris noctiluca partitivirus-like virus 1]
MDNWGSSPGLPWRQLGFKTKRQVADDPYAFQSIRRFWHLVKEGNKVSLPDCAAFVRPHLVERGEKKVRAVWGYPCTVSFQEACFALPLIEAYKKVNTPFAYGYETARGGCRRIFLRFVKHKHFLSNDYKSFDKTIPPWLTRIAFDILLSNLDLTEYQDRGIPDSEKLYRAWKKLVKYFIETPIRLCNGERYRKKKGIASGSYFTQLIGSIANYIATKYCILSQNIQVKDMLVLGDDSLVATDRAVSLDQLVSDAKRFGLIINDSKTQRVNNVRDVKFLGYTINDGGPSRPRKELCAALAHPERPDQDFNEFATRTLGLMIANFGHDVDFHCLCFQILQSPFKLSYNPSFVRYLRVLGIEELPKAPPDLFKLQLMRYR